MHSADLSVLKPWGEVPCVVKVLVLKVLLFFAWRYLSPLPSTLSDSCKPAQGICYCQNCCGENEWEADP